MADVATLQKGFMADMASAEFYAARVTPPIRMTNRLFEDYQNIHNQIPSAAATVCMTKIIE